MFKLPEECQRLLRPSSITFSKISPSLSRATFTRSREWPVMPTPRLPVRPLRRERRGTTVVETALVLPVFLVFVFSLVEFSHALMVKNMLRSACRTGARLGSTDGQSTANVESAVSKALGSVIDPTKVTVMVRDAGVFDSGGDVPTTGEHLDELPPLELEDAEPRQLFMVRARVAYNDIALVPMPFMRNVVLEGQSFVRHE